MSSRSFYSLILSLIHNVNRIAVNKYIKNKIILDPSDALTETVKLIVSKLDEDQLINLNEFRKERLYSEYVYEYSCLLCIFHT